MKADVSVATVPVIDIQTIFDYCLVSAPEPYNTLPCVRSPFDRCELRCKSMDSNGSKTVDTRFFVDGDADSLGLVLTVSIAGSRPITVCQADMKIDDRGKILGSVSVEARDLPAGDHREYVDPLISCALNALCFLHTKGARIDVPYFPSRNARRQWERSAQQIKSLRIEPLERYVMDIQSGSDAGRRAHLVRGTWADYSRGGFMGDPNAKGIWWRPPHVRGNPKHGIVAKQYETGEVK